MVSWTPQFISLAGDNILTEIRNVALLVKQICSNFHKKLFHYLNVKQNKPREYKLFWTGSRAFMLIRFIQPRLPKVPLQSWILNNDYVKSHTSTESKEHLKRCWLFMYSTGVNQTLRSERTERLFERRLKR